jgi:hypothetical protein
MSNLSNLEVKARYGDQNGQLRPVQRFGDLLKCQTIGTQVWQNGQELVLRNNEDSLLTRVVHLHDEWIYLYLRATGPNLMERRNLPRLSCQLKASVQTAESIRGELTSMHWTGFTLHLPKEADRLKLKLFKKNALLQVDLAGKAFQAEVHFIHGKSIQTNVGVVVTSVTLEDFETLSAFIANHSETAQSADHPGRWLDALISS